MSNVASNVDNTASISGIVPTNNSGIGEVTISLTPGINNNNSNHFTYLGGCS